ncbi:pentatricopeptide repeat-containing protein [Canna indica]|uniref:Pentatricopeptide repeat-containing protein n=1 Tax=Canna indica TaxID=4628 RepID=A0AAQ3QAW5_9LILI|nr:pentatricopeptide repeat-containing protein [Canna indica]
MELHWPLAPPPLPKPLSQTQLFFPCRKQRVLIFSLSKSTPPLLQDSSSNDLQTIPLPPVPSQTLPATGADITNGFIQGACKNPQTEALAFEYYQQAKQQQQPTFRPDRKILKLLIRILVKSKQWSSISTLVDDFGTFNVIPDGSTCARLVASCIRARKFKLAESILQVLQTKKGGAAASAFSSAMCGYNQLHMYNCTVAAHERMTAAGLSLNSGCYRRIIEAYSELGDTEKVVALFLEFDSANSETSSDSVEICSILCESLGKSGRAFEALRYFREMEGKGMPPNSAIYGSLMSSFAGIREAEIVDDLFHEALAKRMVRDQAVLMKLVSMYVDVEQLEKTLEVAQAMRKMEINVSDCIFCTIINGFAKKRGLRSAVAAYEQLISIGCEPGQVTYASIINVYCRLGLSRMAEAAFSEMIDKGFDKCVVAYSNMISMYGKIGKVRDAMRLLAKMKEKGCAPNVWVYNSLLDIHGRLMDLRQVEKLWREMKRRNIAPDKVSYTSTINAYSKARRIDECIGLFEEFKKNGGKVDRALAGIMVGVFSKGSRFEELIKLLRQMQLEGTDLDERLHESALNALRDAGLQIHLNWFERSFDLKDKT